MPRSATQVVENPPGRFLLAAHHFWLVKLVGGFNPSETYESQLG